MDRERLFQLLLRYNEDESFSRTALLDSICALADEALAAQREQLESVGDIAA